MQTDGASKLQGPTNFRNLRIERIEPQVLVLLIARGETVDNVRRNDEVIYEQFVSRADRLREEIEKANSTLRATILGFKRTGKILLRYFLCDSYLHIFVAFESLLTYIRAVPKTGLTLIPFDGIARPTNLERATLP
jgi:hypothetical protein